MDEAQQAFIQALVDQLREGRGSQVRSLSIESYESGTDFDAYIRLFEDVVKATYNLKDTDVDKVKVNCLKWLPVKLKVGATRSAYDILTDAQKNDWIELKRALTLAFRNKSEEIHFINNENAFKRSGMPLREYRDGMVQRMDKYMPNLRGVDEEWQRCAVRRFRAGLMNPVLEAHILMSCNNDRHTLDHAYSVACTYENTLNTISQTSGVGPNNALASVLPIAQFSALSLEAPQLGALSGQNEKNERRFESLEANVKKTELDITEVKTGLTEVKETMKEIKDTLTSNQNKTVYQFQRPARPFAQGPRQLFNPYGRQMNTYPRVYRPFNMRPQNQTGITPGLTGGPGYVNQQAGQTTPQTNAQNVENKQNDMGNRSATMGAVGEQNEGTGQEQYASWPFANPNLQWGLIDQGYGWTDEYVTDGQTGQEVLVLPDGQIAVGQSQNF